MKKLLLIAAIFACFHASSRGSAAVIAAQPKGAAVQQSDYSTNGSAHAISSYYEDMKAKKLCQSNGGYYAEHKTLGAMKVTMKSQSKVNYKGRWFYLSAFKDLNCN